MNIITNMHNQVMTNELSTAHQIIHRSLLDIRINERLYSFGQVREQHKGNPLDGLQTERQKTYLAFAFKLFLPERVPALFMLDT